MKLIKGDNLSLFLQTYIKDTKIIKRRFFDIKSKEDKIRVKTQTDPLKNTLRLNRLRVKRIRFEITVLIVKHKVIVNLIHHIKKEKVIRKIKMINFDTK